MREVNQRKEHEAKVRDLERRIVAEQHEAAKRSKELGRQLTACQRERADLRERLDAAQAALRDIKMEADYQHTERNRLQAWALEAQAERAGLLASLRRQRIVGIAAGLASLAAFVAWCLS